MNDETDNEARPATPTREQELARKAADVVKAGKPQFKRLMAFTRPRAEKAGREAARYVREHESEIKGAAAKLAQARLRGPLGMAVGALAGSASASGSQAVATCPRCATANPPLAKFCHECGLRLAPEPAAEEPDGSDEPRPSP